MFEDELAQIVSTAKEIAYHYTQATSIPCTIVDIGDSTASFESICSLCHFKTDDTPPEFCRMCQQEHLHSCHLSERFGGSYIYFCHLSLMFWASPIIHEGIMKKAYIAGPVRVLEDNEILRDAQGATDLELDDGSLSYFREGLSSIPKLNISQTRSLSEILRMCAAWTSGYFEKQLLENQEYTDQQSRISEYIQEIKQRFDDEEDDRAGAYPIEKEQQLLQAMRRGDRQQSQALLNEILGSIFFSSGSRMDLIRFRVQELIVLLSRASINGGAAVDEVLRMNDTYQHELEKFVSLEAISYWLSKVLKKYIRLVFSAKKFKHVTKIEQVLRFVHNHHTEKISLQEVAFHVGLSPTHLSRIFNEEMGCSFSSYLNQNRIDHAKTLLRTTEYTLVDIAGIVGYDDQSYFSKLFKQFTGITPGKYRERAGLYPSNNNEIHS